MNTGSAIGIGSTWPPVMSTCRAACDGSPAIPMATIAAAIAYRADFKLMIMASIRYFRTASPREHFHRVEIQYDASPSLVFFDRQPVVGLAAQDCPDRR